MSTKQRSILLLLALISSLMILPPPVAAQSAWGGQCLGSGSSSDVATIAGITCLFGNVLTIALTGIGLIMFIMIIVGGFKILTGSGDPKTVDAGKKTITLAIIGLVVAILAWFILSFISEFTGVEFTNFSIPTL